MHYEDHAEEEGHAVGGSATAVSMKTASAFEERPPIATDSGSVTATVTRLREPFETGAEKYAQAWPQPCAAALDLYKKDLEHLGAPFGLKTDSDIINHVRAAYAAKESFTERLRAMSEEPIDEERMERIADVFSDIAYYRSPNIGFSALACIVFQLPKFLGIGHYWAGIFPTQEMHHLRTASIEDLKLRPPVFISKIVDSDDFCVFILGDRRAFTKQDVGPEIAGRLRELEQLRIRDDISVALASEGYSEELRAAYHSFALLFWNWYVSRSELAKADPIAVVEPLYGDYLKVTNGIETRGVIAAFRNINDLDKWSGTGAHEMAHTLIEKKGALVVSISGDELSKEARGELKGRAGDVFTVLLAHALNNSRNVGLHAFHSITPEVILDELGVARKTKKSEAGIAYTCGHRPENIKMVTACINYLRNRPLYVARLDVYLPGPKGKLIKEECRMGGWTLEVQKFAHRPTNKDGSALYKWFTYKVFPGFEDVINLNHYANIPRVVLAYNPLQQAPEKHLGYYLSEHNALNGGAPFYRKVEDLLSVANIKLSVPHPEDTRVRLETALNRLRKDGVYTNWSYYADGRRITLPTLRSRLWRKTWAGMSVEFTFQPSPYQLPGSELETQPVGSSAQTRR